MSPCCLVTPLPVLPCYLCSVVVKIKLERLAEAEKPCGAKDSGNAVTRKIERDLPYESELTANMRRYSQHSRLYRNAGVLILVVSAALLFLVYSNSPPSKIPPVLFAPSLPFANLSECYLGRELHCPDIRRKGKTTQRQFELVLTRMLRVFDLIAKKHKIRYWLYKGTLLGAVRNSGYNVFDNDLDVAILRKDYEVFLREGAKDLPEDMFLQTEESDPYWQVVPYSNMLAKIRDKNSCYRYCSGYGCEHRNGLMIDVFVIDRDAKGFLLEVYTSSITLFRFLFGPKRRPEGDIFPLTEKVFDGYYFPIPCHWNRILVERYGRDFMQTPNNHNFGFEGVDPLEACSSKRDH